MVTVTRLFFVLRLLGFRSEFERAAVLHRRRLGLLCRCRRGLGGRCCASAWLLLLLRRERARRRRGQLAQALLAFAPGACAFRAQEAAGLSARGGWRHAVLRAQRLLAIGALADRRLAAGLLFQ